MIPTTVGEFESEIERIRKQQAESKWLIAAWGSLAIATLVGYLASRHVGMIFMAGAFLSNSVVRACIYRRDVERITKYKAFSATLEELANPKNPLSGSFGKVTTARIPQRHR